MKKISLILFATLLSCSLFGLKVTSDEKFTLSGKVTSISLTDQGGVINVSSKAGRYGKVFLTYNLKIDNPNFCLLYTSPSPRDSDSSRMPSSA